MQSDSATEPYARLRRGGAAGLGSLVRQGVGLRHHSALAAGIPPPSLATAAQLGELPPMLYALELSAFPLEQSTQQCQWQCVCVHAQWQAMHTYSCVCMKDEGDALHVAELELLVHSADPM